MTYISYPTFLEAPSINAQRVGEAVRPDGAADETLVMHVGSAFLQRDHKSYHSGARIRRGWAVLLPTCISWKSLVQLGSRNIDS